jgi:hypothetical protein
MFKDVTVLKPFICIQVDCSHVGTWTIGQHEWYSLQWSRTELKLMNSRAIITSKQIIHATSNFLLLEDLMSRDIFTRWTENSILHDFAFIEVVLIESIVHATQVGLSRFPFESTACGSDTAFKTKCGKGVL